MFGALFRGAVGLTGSILTAGFLATSGVGYVVQRKGKTLAATTLENLKEWEKLEEWATASNVTRGIFGNVCRYLDDNEGVDDKATSPQVLRLQHEKMYGPTGTEVGVTMAFRAQAYMIGKPTLINKSIIHINLEQGRFRDLYNEQVYHAFCMSAYHSDLSIPLIGLTYLRTFRNNVFDPGADSEDATRCLATTMDMLRAVQSGRYVLYVSDAQFLTEEHRCMLQEARLPGSVKIITTEAIPDPPKYTEEDPKLIVQKLVDELKEAQK